jgi:glycosyltransferase involved in cell wall biosynthesis
MTETRSQTEEKISIALCTYNGARYLQEQLDSIAEQTRLPDELVVCDDGSTDETPEIIARFAARAPFAVRSHRNEKNLGSTQNFAKAIGLCAGELIVLSDQDDVWMPRKLERLAAAFAAEPRPAAVNSDAELVDAQLRGTGRRLWENVGFTPVGQRAAENGRLIDVLLGHNVVTGATLAFRASYRDLILPIPENCVHDAWIALLLAAVADWAIIRESLVLYRQHADNQIGGGKRSLRKALSNTSAVYAQEAGCLDSALQRLRSFPCLLIKAGALEMLLAKIAHLKARASLPRFLLKRWPIVFRELAAGRYRLYSNGWKSVIRDL